LIKYVILIEPVNSDILKTPICCTVNVAVVSFYHIRARERTEYATVFSIKLYNPSLTGFLLKENEVKTKLIP